MHEMKTNLLLFVCFQNVFIIRFVNDPHIPYNRLNAGRLARFRKTRKHVNEGKRSAELFL